jgi:carbamoyl-phosphate synthase large subunit
MKVPYYTTMASAVATTEAIAALREGSLEVAPLQSYNVGVEAAAGL